MRKSKQQIDFIITGIGVVSNTGQGKEVFTSNLISGNSTFNQLKRSGRQLENKFFIGNEIELRALKRAKLNNAYINSTKSIIGHGLTAAGTVEVIATLLQMKASKLHPSLNLEEPIDSSFNWIKGNPINHEIKKAITLSVGFGGINTALCLEKK